MKPLLLSLLILTLSACTAAPVPHACLAGKPAVQTQLYFGRDKPQGGKVSPMEWQGFVRQEIAPRFPEGFSVVDARGFWLGEATRKMIAEDSHLVIRIHDGGAAADAAIADIIAGYKHQFAQEAVLRVDAPVCAGF